MIEMVVTTGELSCAMLQSKCHHQQTNTRLLYRLAVLPVTNQQCQSTEGKHYRHLRVQYTMMHTAYCVFTK